MQEDKSINQKNKNDIPDLPVQELAKINKITPKPPQECQNEVEE